MFEICVKSFGFNEGRPLYIKKKKEKQRKRKKGMKKKKKRTTTTKPLKIFSVGRK